MKCFTWTTSGLSAGLQVRADGKLGQVVFLGEEGRGRRYEKVSMSRRNPAEIVDERVMNANPVKITLPAKDGKPEISFFVLERPTSATQNVLVRINSNGGYIRNGQGGWKNVAGLPELLVKGYGAFGDAGRIGNWDDGLVVMHPGDVIRIHPSRTWGKGDFALWLDEAGQLQTASWQDYETISAIHTAEATVADVEEKPQGLLLLAGQMPCFSFKGGNITSGLKLEKGAAGVSVRLGEEGRGRKLTEVPIIGEAGEAIELLEKAAVVDLGKGIFGLVQSERIEPSACLVRVSTEQAYTRRGNGSWELWKGNPIVMTKGNGADGDAGGIGSWDEGLFILREGDVVRVRPSGDGPAYALFVKDGKIKSEPWIAWKVEDAKRDPNFYVAKGTAPWGHVPPEWIGRVIQTMEMGERGMSGGSLIPSFQERETGELISIEPFVLNLGWDGQDRHDMIVRSALWVALTDKKVRRLEGEEAEKRKLIRAEAEDLRNKAITITKQSYFELTEANLCSNVQELIKDQGFDTMPTEGWSSNSLISWVEKAKGILERFAAVEQELKTLEQRQSSGEIRVNFGGHFREMGASGNSQYWVIKPNGSEREPDEVDYRKRYTSEGDKKWRAVNPEELAISWFKVNTAAEHEFVNKFPVGGCTSEQLAKVKGLEQEIERRFKGTTGMSGKVSPSIGNGWNLGGKKPKEVKEEKTEENNNKTDLSKLLQQGKKFRLGL